MIRSIFVLAFTLATAAGAGEVGPAPDLFEPDDARNRVVLEQAADAVGMDLVGVQPEGQGVSLQPLDDSDSEMKELIQRYYQLVPCRDEYTVVVCQKAIDTLASGGDRLARYLIPHIEANDRGGFPNKDTYVLLLGRSQSPIAYDYLRKRMLDAASKAERDEDARLRMHTALQAVGFTRELPAIDDAISLMARFPEDVEVTNLAVNVIDRVQAKHGPQPRGEQALRQVRERFADAGPDLDGDGRSPGGIRDRVERMLATPGRTR